MLKLKSISKFFAGNYRAVLNNLNLEINQGDFCVVIGSNGSGKSTLLKLLSGELKADQGKIDFTNKFIATVTQDINKGTIPEMSLLENMSLSRMSSKGSGFSFYKRSRSSILDKVKELGLGLEKFLDQPLSNLSGGQRQTIATLMAMDSEPDVLLLDEHTSALDPRSEQLLMNYTVGEISKNKITAIMVTHKLDDAVKYGNRLIMLHQGKLVMDVKGKDKESLTAAKLLELFHEIEEKEFGLD